MDEFEFDGASRLTPRDYARLKGMAPQLVYYYIRTGVLTVEWCDCGRKVLDVERSNKALQGHMRKETT